MFIYFVFKKEHQLLQYSNNDFDETELEWGTAGIQSIAKLSPLNAISTKHKNTHFILSILSP